MSLADRIRKKQEERRLREIAKGNEEKTRSNTDGGAAVRLASYAAALRNALSGASSSREYGIIFGTTTPMVHIAMGNIRCIAFDLVEERKTMSKGLHDVNLTDLTSGQAALILTTCHDPDNMRTHQMGLVLTQPSGPERPLQANLRIFGEHEATIFDEDLNLYHSIEANEIFDVSENAEEFADRIVDTIADYLSRFHFAPLRGVSSENAASSYCAGSVQEVPVDCAVEGAPAMLLG